MKNLIHLSGKTALVTGGSRGVGRAVAYLLARAGAKVGITYCSREKEAHKSLQIIHAQGSSGWAQQVNMESHQEIGNLFERVDQEWPDGLDIFIANAGIWPAADVPVGKMTTDRWRKTLAVNLDAVFFATNAADARMRKNGRIVYVSSTAAQRGEAFHADYAASKGALHALVKGLCVELAPRNITVNAVAPGWIDTEMSHSAYADGRLQQIEKGIPLGRVATTEDVAGPIVFLCSELARHITGEIINVNGGAILCG